ncbi:hypothetical protein DFJ77DRAFT_431143 [Powellomyces hirtus]|nr:hypothetical protein DFJ77DRAFT_431143 [Powellomyces hirtus]
MSGNSVDDDIEACPNLPPRAKPTSVHDLRIDDVRVIAALGDSITAAFGANGVQRGDPPSMRNTMEDRGISFSMGGDDGAFTLANFIQRFEPRVRGASIGSHRAEICYGVLCPPMQYHKNDRLNAAQSGAMIPNLIAELEHLIRAMKSDSDINWASDFKLLTIFIGNNDACLGCAPGSGSTYLSPAAYEATMRSLLERIQTAIPRVVVNIMMGFNVSQVYDLTVEDPYCQGLRRAGTVFECVCAFLPGPMGEANRQRMDVLTQQYNARLQSLARFYNTHPRPDSFAVIVDPLLSNVRVKEWNLKFLSNSDCFHPAAEAHALMAKGVWWNLFRPPTRKRTKLVPDEGIPVWCPGRADRIATQPPE